MLTTTETKKDGGDIDDVIAKVRKRMYWKKDTNNDGDYDGGEEQQQGMCNCSSLNFKGKRNALPLPSCAGCIPPNNILHAHGDYDGGEE